MAEITLFAPFMNKASFLSGSPENRQIILLTNGQKNVLEQPGLKMGAKKSRRKRGERRLRGECSDLPGKVLGQIVEDIE